MATTANPARTMLSPLAWHSTRCYDSPMCQSYYFSAASIQSVLTIVIAASVAYIALRQWLTARDKLRLDLYDRRLLIYREVVEYLSLMMQSHEIKTEDLGKFRAATSEADFLFDPEISKYIDEVGNKAMKLWEAKFVLPEVPEGLNRQKTVSEIVECATWFSGQHEIAKKKFMKYIDISKL
jgi:hypothetical protein